MVDAIRQIGVSEVTSVAPGVRRAEERAGGPRAREQPAAQGGLWFDTGQAHSAGGRPGETSKPRALSWLYRAGPSAAASVAPERRSGSIPPA